MEWCGFRTANAGGGIKNDYRKSTRENRGTSDMKFKGHSKYNAKRVTVDGIIFHSKREAAYYQNLCLQMRAGEIDRFERQVKFVLIPKQDGEREVAYFADFVTYKDNKRVAVIDVKGVRLPEYVIKRKLMRWVYGIKILEV